MKVRFLDVFVRVCDDRVECLQPCQLLRWWLAYGGTVVDHVLGVVIAREVSRRETELSPRVGGLRIAKPLLKRLADRLDFLDFRQYADPRFWNHHIICQSYAVAV